MLARESRSLRLSLALLQRLVTADKGQFVPAAAGGSVRDQLSLGLGGPAAGRRAALPLSCWGQGVAQPGGQGGGSRGPRATARPGAGSSGCRRQEEGRPQDPSTVLLPRGPVLSLGGGALAEGSGSGRPLSSSLPCVVWPLGLVAGLAGRHHAGFPESLPQLPPGGPAGQPGAGEGAAAGPARPPRPLPGGERHHLGGPGARPPRAAGVPRPRPRMSTPRCPTPLLPP